MSDPPVPEVSLADLGPRSPIGSGGQGTVFALAEEPGLVYKEYAARFVDDLDVTALNRFVRLAAEGGPDAESLLRLAAWPTAVVRKDGVVRGFLMPRVPEQFTVRIALPGGPATVLAQLQYLLNSEDYLRARGLAVDDRLRLELLRDTGEALLLLHRLGICVGDLSPNNLLFSATTRPRCYFLDCDAMRLDGDSVLAQAETPEWQLPVPGGAGPGEELATVASDAYKFGLLVVRLFAGDQQVRDPGAAGRRLRGGLRQLAVHSLDADPAARPAPKQWLGPLDRAIANTPPSPPPPPPPEPEAAPAPATAGQAEQPRRAVPRAARRPARPVRRFWPVFAGAVAVFTALIVGLLNRGNPGTPTTGTQVNDGLPAYTAPAYNGQALALPTLRPNLPLSSQYPGLLRPTLNPSILCLVTDVKVGSGINAKSSRVKAAVSTVEDFSCWLGDDGRDALAGASPSATQRSRLAKLAAKAPFTAATITGVSTGTNGKPQVNVVFKPFGAASSGCWRSRLSLVDADGGYAVGSLTAPVAATCR